MRPTAMVPLAWPTAFSAAPLGCLSVSRAVSLILPSGFFRGTWSSLRWSTVRHSARFRGFSPSQAEGRVRRERAPAPVDGGGVVDGSGDRPERVVLGEQLVDARLVEPGDDVLVLLGVADALGERERRGGEEEGAEPEEGTDPGVHGEVEDREDHGQQGDAEGDARLQVEGAGVLGLVRSAHGRKPRAGVRSAGSARVLDPDRGYMSTRTHPRPGRPAGGSDS